jgi:hypothetical protein
LLALRLQVVDVGGDVDRLHLAQVGHAGRVLVM